MYRKLDNLNWRRELRISQDIVIKGLIIHGNWEFHKDIEMLLQNESDIIETSLSNIYLFKKNSLYIGLAGTFGAAMTADIVHMFCTMGCPIVIQTGLFGALQPGMRLFDVLIPFLAYRGEGASDWYLNKSIPADSSNEISNKLAQFCSNYGIKHHRGTIYSTSAMHAESWEIIQQWQLIGFKGVDLETATTFSVAKHFNAKRAAILQLVDNLVEGHTWNDLTQKDFSKIEERNKQIFTIAKNTILEFSK